MKRVFVYTRKMFALKTEVLGQSGTTVATGLTSFIYLKHKIKKKYSQYEGPFSKRALWKSTVFERKDRVNKSGAISSVMLNAIFVLESLPNLSEILQKEKRCLAQKKCV